jgi:hypothetical protein
MLEEGVLNGANETAFHITGIIEAPCDTACPRLPRLFQACPRPSRCARLVVPTAAPRLDGWDSGTVRTRGSTALFRARQSGTACAANGLS